VAEVERLAGEAARLDAELAAAAAEEEEEEDGEEEESESESSGGDSHAHRFVRPLRSSISDDEKEEEEEEEEEDEEEEEEADERADEESGDNEAETGAEVSTAPLPATASTAQPSFKGSVVRFESELSASHLPWAMRGRTLEGVVTGATVVDGTLIAAVVVKPQLGVKATMAAKTWTCNLPLLQLRVVKKERSC
jgi:type IV secretory pathway VirB10-like protein